MATAAGSLLTGRRMAFWMHSPTGRMSMKQSGMRMGTTRNLGGMIWEL